MPSRLLREPQRLVNSCQGLFYVLPFDFDFGEQSVKEWEPKLDSRRRNYRDALSKFLAPGFTITETCARPTGIRHPVYQIMPDSMLSAQPDDPRCIA